MAIRSPSTHSHHNWLIKGGLFLVSISILGVVFARTHDSLTSTDPQSSRTGAAVSEQINLPGITPDALSQDQATKTETPWQDITVHKGDTLSTIFSRLKIHSQLRQITKFPEIKKLSTSIRPGDQLQFLIENGKLAEFIYHKSTTERLRITRGAKGFSVSTVEDPVEKRQAHAAGSIDDSLFLAGKRAGISENLIMQLAEIFEYDIDFALDIRKGDRFEVIYEERFSNGKKLKDGAILAAIFVNQGKPYYAFRYTTPKGVSGYYDATGRSLKKAFTRTPVKFTRISSGFNPKRMHPILHRIRAHKGVDYAAPKGTPIKTTGNGRISFAGWKKGYGKTIVITHGNKYSTLYAHLSGFKKGIKKGRRVSQGEVIGYVGKTGSATGYHLHYEFRINGVHKNPVTVKLPKSAPLAKALKADFLTKTASLKAQLEHYASRSTE